MMARRMFDGTIRLDLSPAEFAAHRAALEHHASTLSAHGAKLGADARILRDRAAKIRRGRHAAYRIAGELELQSRQAVALAEAAMDMLRVVSAIDSPANPQLVTPSQIEE